MAQGQGMKDIGMLLNWVLIFLVGTVITAVIGFTSIATGVAQLLFFIFLGGFVIALVLYLREKKYIKWF